MRLLRMEMFNGGFSSATPQLRSLTYDGLCELTVNGSAVCLAEIRTSRVPTPLDRRRFAESLWMVRCFRSLSGVAEPE